MDTSGASKGRDPRQERTRVRVFAAAREVLRREGLGGVTMDAIASEASVARSTLYRNWPGRDELLAEAFDDLVDVPVVADPALPVREQLMTVLVGLARALRASEWGATLPAVVAAIEVSPAIAADYGRLTDERRAVVVRIVEAAVERGELPPAIPVEEVIDALVGPLFYRRLVRQLPTPRPWIARHLDRTLRALEVAPAPE